MRYNLLVPLFSDELGSVRDIYVMDAGIETWERPLDSLRDSQWDHELRLVQQPVTFVPVAKIFAEASPEAYTYDLRISVGGSWLWCHFYSVAEIEFSFHARQMDLVTALKRLVDFMSWLGVELEKDVKLRSKRQAGIVRL